MRKRLRLILAGVVLCAAGCVQLDKVQPVLRFPGELPVKRWNTTYDGLLPLVVFYPDTDPPQKDLPLVIFNPGWNQIPASYLMYGIQLAQWGYVAVIRMFPTPGLGGMLDLGFQLGIDTNDEQAHQNSAVIDWCAQETLRPESPLFGMVDVSKVGNTGHSLGARVTIAAVLEDPRITASVNLDSIYDTDTWPFADRLGETDAAILWIGSGIDSLCGDRFGAGPLFDSAKPPTLEVIIEGADHLDFMELLPLLESIAAIPCGRGWADKHDVQAIATRYMIAWFNVYLKGLTEYEAYFHGAYSQQDESAELVRIRANL